MPRKKTSQKKTSDPSSTNPAEPAPVHTDQLMIVNDVPGEECRIALLEDGRLEELYSERVATATNVNNIYKGRVTNVEPAIQAAFVDFGKEQSGFLHISDLHPRYFPSGDKTERVGKKIPRRDRPPIQDALKRGDSILVQVIKEGIGTKGPTLTSYMSIPGRLMVMMPHMDRVGVSRKIEDEERRREMRKTLDSLELPEGMGFILRTAGFGQTKTELKRDLAFLNRLWKQMAKRIDSVQAPCPLYVESDLLIRTIRDVLNPNIGAIIVDSESAHQRALDFLRVIAPRSAPPVIRYHRPTPLFHAFGIERQIELIHSREVPLPSGGAIVIDQTEALLAIDVNSGRSRSARDAETNAFRTNREAVDEICRQLRLRDLGGLVINDLIDMRRHENRRKIEAQFEANLARDRAKTSITQISEFGILEMTRQRMRPSMRKTHYHACSHCDGRGEVRTPDSMASEALRHVAYLLQHQQIHSVEMVCSTRIASTFLSGKRRELVEIEESFGKSIRIRVSDSIATSRIDYYAYDERSADVDISKLPSVTAPTVAELTLESDQGAPVPAPERSGKKGSRRRGTKKVASLGATFASAAMAEELNAIEREDESASDDDEAKPAKKRRRRRRGRRSKSESTESPESQPTQDTAGTNETAETPPAEDAVEAESPEAGEDQTSTAEPVPATKSKRRRRRRRKKATTEEASTTIDTEQQAGDSTSSTDDEPTDSAVASESDTKPKSRRRRSRRRGRKPAEVEADATEPSAESPRVATDSGGSTDTEKPAKKKRVRRRRKKSTAATEDNNVASTVDEVVESSTEESTDAAEDGAAAPRSLYRSRRRVPSGTAREAIDRSSA